MMEGDSLGSALVLVAEVLTGGVEEVSRSFQAMVARHRGESFHPTNSSKVMGARFAHATDAVAMLSAIQSRSSAAAHLLPLQMELRSVLGPNEMELESITDLLPLAHAGQVLATPGVALGLRLILPPDAALRSLGPHRLRDLQRVEEVFQVTLPGARQEFPPLRSLDHTPNNLPAQLTSFVGRREALTAVAERLSTSRMVTLTGAGGSGKTRLALQVGAELLDEYPEGIWMVDLSSLSDPALVAAAVVAALQLKEDPGRPTLEILRAALATRRLLVILDNCEHLITSCAYLANRLLADSPLFSILATSREPLGIPGEVVWPVPALSIPDPGVWPSQQQLLQYESAQLFIQRARAAQSTFTISPQQTVALATICRRLDGIPLALELAAARTRILSVEQIAERLDDRLRLLAASGRTSLPRHQTLRATIDWSYELLTEQERSFWRRLAVFGGSFSLEAVEGICACEQVDPVEAIDLLAHLVDKSLVVAEEHDGVKRYRLLETMRQYARTRLVEAGEEEELFSRYCEWYITWTPQSDPRTMERREWLDRLEREHDNIRQAVQWAIESGHEGHALRLCAEVWFFWMVRGYTSDWNKVIRLAERPVPPGNEEAWSTVQRAVGALWIHLGRLDKAEDALRQNMALSHTKNNPLLLGATLNNLSVVLSNSGRYAEALEAAAEAVAIMERFDLTLRAAWTRVNLAGIYFAIGELENARRWLEEGLAQQSALGEQSGEAFSSEYLGLTLMMMGDLGAAQSHLETSLQLREALRDPRGVAASTAGLGELALRQGELDRAERLLWQSVTLRQQAGALAGINTSLDTLAWLYAARGEWAKALQMTGAADALRKRQGVHRWPIYDMETEERLAPAYIELGEAGAREAFVAGSRLTQDELLAMAESHRTISDRSPAPLAAVPATEPPTLAPSADRPNLTPREQEIIKLLAQGQTAREIGAKLFLSPRTVEKHEENIRNKIGVPNRAALVAWAAQHGLAN